MACDSIREEFSDLGINIEDEIVLSELAVLLARYNIDATKISCEFFSFNSKHHLGVKPPTLESLAQFENEKLRNGKRRPLDPIEGVENLPECEEIGGGSPARLVSKRGPATPESHLAKRFVSAVGSPVVSISAPCSPSLTPSSGPGLRYSERKNRAEVVVRHNLDIGQDWETEGPATTEVHIKQVQTVKQPYKFMFSRMRDTAAVLDETMCRLRERLVTGHSLLVDELVDLSITHPGTGVAVGRVQCDSEGRLNSNSVVLQGSLDWSAGATVPVDLSQAAQYSLFPGQVVAVDCSNPTGSRLICTKVYDGVSHPVGPCRLDEAQTITVLSAVGPYTTTDSYSSEPLQDLLDVIADKKPDVAILMGPFVDMKNSSVLSSNESFDKQWINTLSLIGEKLGGLETKVVLVPSGRDAVGYPVYPQPPFPPSSHYGPNLKCVSDPAILDIAGVQLALTSTDVLFHLGKEEICFPPRSGDRMSRLASHLLQQGSLYPLYPPSEEINLDIDKLESFALLDSQAPHVLLLPSDLNNFVRDISGTTVINPGRLTKGVGPGTYSIFKLSKGEEGKLQTRVKIIRI